MCDEVDALRDRAPPLHGVACLLRVIRILLPHNQRQHRIFNIQDGVLPYVLRG
jgi:hypothetical protein